MAGEQAEALPDDLRDWVEEKAAELDASTETVLTRAVAAYRLVEDETAPDPATLDSQLSAVDESLDSLADRVADLEGDLDEKIQDVRERVIQVKRETDAKAPADHDHPDLSDRLSRRAKEVEAVETDLADLESRIDAGFENYEEVLGYLTDETDELAGKVTRLASVVVDLRHRANDLEAAAVEREAAAEIKAEANRLGVRTAVCDECDGQVDVGLLTTARCPHCSTPFSGIDPPRGFFGSATLVPGRRPALEGRSDVIEEPEELFDENRAADDQDDPDDHG